MISGHHERQACKTNPGPLGTKAAFSLIEILVVVAVVAVLAALSVPAVVGSLEGSRLATAGQSVQDTLARARQVATGKNATVEVRCYKYAEDAGPPKFRALQTFLITSGSARPLDRGLVLPPGIQMSEEPDLSPWLTSSNHPEIAVQDGALPGRGSGYRYRAFRFTPGGSADLLWGENHLTLVAERSAGTNRANFFTVQVLPVSGGVRAFRP